MMRKLVLPICLAAVMACGDDDTSPEGDGGNEPHQDAAVHDASSTIDATTGSDAGDAGAGRLQSGTYKLSKIVKKKDECLLALEDGTLPTTELVNTQDALSIGRKYDSTTDPKFVPEGYGLGTGPYHATTPPTASLSLATHVTVSDGCEYDLVRKTEVTYTGNNAVSVDYTDTETNHNSSCKAPDYPTANCTSEYTFDLTKEP